MCPLPEARVTSSSPFDVGRWLDEGVEAVDPLVAGPIRSLLFPTGLLVGVSVPTASIVSNALSRSRDFDAGARLTGGSMDCDWVELAGPASGWLEVLRGEGESLVGDIERARSS